MFSISLPRRLAIFLAIATAMLCGSERASAGVITQSSWSEHDVVASASVPVDGPQRDALSDNSQGGMEGVPLSSGGGSQTVGIASGLVQLADASVTGRLAIVDRLLPDDPVLDGLPKPA